MLQFINFRFSVYYAKEFSDTNDVPYVDCPTFFVRPQRSFFSQKSTYKLSGYFDSKFDFSERWKGSSYEHRTVELGQ